MKGVAIPMAVLLFLTTKISADDHTDTENVAEREEIPGNGDVSRKLPDEQFTSFWESWELWLLLGSECTQPINRPGFVVMHDIYFSDFACRQQREYAQRAYANRIPWNHKIILQFVSRAFRFVPDAAVASCNSIGIWLDIVFKNYESNAEYIYAIMALLRIGVDFVRLDVIPLALWTFLLFMLVVKKICLYIIEGIAFHAIYGFDFLAIDTFVRTTIVFSAFLGCVAVSMRFQRWFPGNRYEALDVLSIAFIYKFMIVDFGSAVSSRTTQWLGLCGMQNFIDVMLAWFVVQYTARFLYTWWRPMILPAIMKSARFVVISMAVVSPKPLPSILVSPMRAIHSMIGPISYNSMSDESIAATLAYRGCMTTDADLCGAIVRRRRILCIAIIDGKRLGPTTTIKENVLLEHLPWFLEEVCKRCERGVSIPSISYRNILADEKCILRSFVHVDKTNTTTKLCSDGFRLVANSLAEVSRKDELEIVTTS
jgi:hypothetical protein